MNQEGYVGRQWWTQVLGNHPVREATLGTLPWILLTCGRLHYITGSNIHIVPCHPAIPHNVRKHANLLCFPEFLWRKWVLWSLDQIWCTRLPLSL